MTTHDEAIALLISLASEWRCEGERIIFVIKPSSA